MDKILPSHDSVVYLDTDLIFLKPVRELYNDFHTFNQTQWCGMGMDWYHHHGHPIPYYGSQGLNAGVGIYNLTRMRSNAFDMSLDKILDEYLNKTKFADQVSCSLINLSIRHATEMIDIDIHFFLLKSFSSRIFSTFIFIFTHKS